MVIKDVWPPLICSLKDLIQQTRHAGRAARMLQVSTILNEGKLSEHLSRDRWVNHITDSCLSLAGSSIDMQ